MHGTLLSQEEFRAMPAGPGRIRPLHQHKQQPEPSWGHMQARNQSSECAILPAPLINHQRHDRQAGTASTSACTKPGRDDKGDGFLSYSDWANPKTLSLWCCHFLCKLSPFCKFLGFSEQLKRPKTELLVANVTHDMQHYLKIGASFQFGWIYQIVLPLE